MSIIKETIEGTKIFTEIKSSNIVNAEYNTSDSELIVEFKTGTKYSYEKVPHKIFTQFRLSESQGKYFAKNIAKKYKYKKV